MTDLIASIQAHYGRAGLCETILAALERAGRHVDSLSRDDIASLDEFHIGGRQATRQLAELAGLSRGCRVLDLGCGIGGPARTVAAEYGCEAVGMDLVPEYCHAAELLTARVGLADRVSFRQGDVTHMPFADASFDVVWLQHALMNIERKPHLLAEARRVLRPAGRLAIHEVLAGPTSPPDFPVPWASDPSISFLVTPEVLREMVAMAGFSEVQWKDVSRSSLEWFRRALAAREGQPAERPRPLGLSLLMGQAAAQKGRNMLRNLEEQRIRVILAVLERGSEPR